MTQKSNQIWVVVEVWRGIPASVEAFRSKKKAQEREKSLKAEINPQDDEVAMFTVTINNSSQILTP
jgi:hypothetical protein